MAVTQNTIMVNRKPILVTGSHRSGTTWVGKMLSASPEVGYIHEPFNLMHRPGICKLNFKHWFTYINSENQDDFIQEIKKMLDFSYNLFDESKELTSLRDGMRMARDFVMFQKYRLTQAKPLIKDPIAFFSAEWFAKEFDADIVVTIRHPAAFISGLKVKNWEFDFSNFTEQPLLMRDYLTPFTSEIQEFAQDRKPILDQGILLWKIFYSIIEEFREKSNNWIFIRQEDLARNPLKEFEVLYKKLNLSFNHEQRTFIEKYTTLSNPSKAPSYKKIFGSNVDLSVKRSSESSIKNWQSRLSPSEINKIRSQTAFISDNFYTDNDWN